MFCFIELNNSFSNFQIYFYLLFPNHNKPFHYCHFSILQIPNYNTYSFISQSPLLLTGLWVPQVIDFSLFLLIYVLSLLCVHVLECTHAFLLYSFPVNHLRFPFQQWWISLITENHRNIDGGKEHKYLIQNNILYALRPSVIAL